MAIQFVGKSVNTAIGYHGEYDISLTSLSDGIDTSAKAGDVVILNFGTSYPSNISLDPVTSGYTKIADLYRIDDDGANMFVCWKVMGSTPDTYVRLPGGPGSNSGAVGIAYVFRGVDNTTPMDVTCTTYTYNAGVHVDCPSITPVTQGAIVLALGMIGSYLVRTVSANPTGYTNLAYGCADIARKCIGVATQKAWSGSGAEDPGAYSMNATYAGDAYCAVTVALRPAVAIGPANLKSYNTNLKANIKSINTNLIANVKSLDTNV